MAVWLVGLFGIVITVCVYAARMVIRDTISYDEAFVWLRKLPPEAGPARRE
ncbi:hypothetical protein KZ483_19545 [Paenibacillus sp. sptzw28]|uniref:hypothetical protein n=1 Tax=Paenibacillus sp. sptzw28 TaxID=715179 RepID=UPI001C6E2160|nr:hypothetical protein [Paenibacillus sp. sptzw28]QYR24406.1 hypothetical protein KZ483_19545 [Paenibacillus sp. sptzw28]